MLSDQEAYLSEIAALMKRGRQSEITQFFQENNGIVQEENFVSYMDALIKKSHMSRAKIAENVALSRDYMYKVLRGDKKTSERDYIIAVCLSMKAELLETQRALELYPFPKLDRDDPRSAIIMSAINNKVSCYTLNDWLEMAGYPLLKVSPDMPSVKVGPARSTLCEQNRVHSKADEKCEFSKPRRARNMEKTNTFVVAEHYGNAPFDFFYMAEFELTDIHKGNKVYAQACFWPDGTTVYGVVPNSVQDDKEPEDALEEYESLEDARASEYFPYFLELDQLTDQKAYETMASVNDTKTYGFRMGGSNTKDGWMMYSEAFNAQQPELCEYLQVRQTPKGYIYSVSHKSYYMQMELGGELEFYYQIYFGKMEKPLYLFEITDLDDLGDYEYYRESFEKMVDYMKRT